MATTPKLTIVRCQHSGGSVRDEVVELHAHEVPGARGDGGRRVLRLAFDVERW
jgi:hypothetical protein